jgi:NADH-quinone oxidoreductase subunit K
MSVFLILSLTLFIIGSLGMFLIRKHLIIILISLELLLLATMLNFAISSVILDDLMGQIYALLILTVAAAESSLGLAILIIYYRLRGGISIDLVSLLKS